MYEPEFKIGERVVTPRGIGVVENYAIDHSQVGYLVSVAIRNWEKLLVNVDNRFWFNGDELRALPPLMQLAEAAE